MAQPGVPAEPLAADASRRVCLPLNEYSDMTEDDYRNAIADAWESDGVVWSRVVALVERALHDYPNSAKLWCVLGSAILMAGITDLLAGITDKIAPDPPDKILRCYEKAASLDATCAEAHEEIGCYYDAIEDDPQRAVVAFKRAISLYAGKTAYIGLARCLAETGNASAALAVLEESTDQDDPDVRKIREEILGGEWQWPPIDN